jgi:hypothetical protein
MACNAITMSVALRSLYLISIFCTLLSLVIHLATFFGFVFFPALFMVPLLFILWPLIVWQWRRIPRRNLVSEIFMTVPLWMKLAGAFCIFYPFINLFICNSLNSGGQPSTLPDGRLVIQNGQQIIRVLDAQSYQYALSIQTRMLSGHLLSFYGLAVIALRAFWIKTGQAMAGKKASGN